MKLFFASLKSLVTGDFDALASAYGGEFIERLGPQWQQNDDYYWEVTYSFHTKEKSGQFLAEAKRIPGVKEL